MLGSSSISIRLWTLSLPFLHSTILHLLVLLLIFCSLFRQHSFILFMGINCRRILILLLLLLCIQRPSTWTLICRSNTSTWRMISVICRRISLAIAWGSGWASFVVRVLTRIFVSISSILCSLLPVNFFSSLSSMRVFCRSGCNS